MKHKNFSHIYIEEAATDYPQTQEVLRRFPTAQTITIKSYKDLFNRPQQEWQLQKQSQKLILAVKPDGLIYKCSDIAPDFGNENFYYNTPLLNCVYDCSYCFLQGMYPSSNLVFFVNTDDFFNAVDATLAQLGDLYLCISYETDLLGFESLFACNRRWIEFARSRPSLTIESRTKSGNFQAIADIEPTENFILSWTLSPTVVQQAFEARTPTLEKRLNALTAALERGWPVRICLDPVLHIDDWKDVYRELITNLQAAIPLERVRDFSIGVFRMNQDFLKKMKKQERSSSVLYYPYQVQDGIATYGDEIEGKLKDFTRQALTDTGVDPSKIVVV